MRVARLGDIIEKRQTRKQEETTHVHGSVYRVSYKDVKQTKTNTKKHTWCDIHPHTLPLGSGAPALDMTQSNGSSWIQQRWPTRCASSSASDSGHGEMTTGCKKQKNKQKGPLWILDSHWLTLIQCFSPYNSIRQSQICLTNNSTRTRVRIIRVTCPVRPSWCRNQAGHHPTGSRHRSRKSAARRARNQLESRQQGRLLVLNFGPVAVWMDQITFGELCILSRERSACAFVRGLIRLGEEKKKKTDLQ